MTLAAGTRLGAYEITRPLGQGGMGEVYAARDTRLDRSVAIKILTSSLAADPAFRDRFEREARTLSRLNHPNICTVYDVGRHGEVDYLVMEYLEGRTLADVLAAGAMPAPDALRVAGQIADALAAAHRHGIVHRDLKPANVMLVGGRGTATAKLLDFGLAKETRVAAAAATSIAGRDETRAPLTGTGTILGTFQYMAPEQVEGREADTRSDVWAFGCLLYELLTGRRAFAADTPAGLIAAILERQPAPIVLPDAALTPGLTRLIAACLEKNPEERFQSMRDVRRELDWIPQRAAASAAPPARPAMWKLAIAGGALVAVTATAAAFLLRRDSAQAQPGTAPVTFSVGLAGSGYTVGPTGIFGGAGSGTPALSPDGRRIAFVAHTASDSLIWMRDFSKLDAEPVRATNGARGLFWSPDGSAIGFFAAGKLKTVDLASGHVEILCDAPAAFGGTWAADGTILFSPAERAPIYKVSAQGGTPAAVTTLTAPDQAHRWPQFLPDGRHFLYMSWSDGTTTRQVNVASVDDPAPKRLFQSQSAAVLAGDYLLYVIDSPARLMAVRFDATALQSDGKPFPLVPDDNVDYQWVTGEPNASVAGTALAYTSGKYRKSQLTWIGRNGRPLGTVGEPGVYFDPVISPDGSMLALEKTDPSRGTGDVWTVDLARGAFSRLTSAAGYETTPVWGPDGRVAYAADQGKTPAIWVNNASGSLGEKLLVSAAWRAFPLDWSPDGRHVVIMLNAGTNRTDMWIHDVGTNETKPLLATPFNEGWARISPDGRWLAYVSDESQQFEVYVRSFPDGAVKMQISTAGGSQPQWRRDGKELFYIAPDNTIMSVNVDVTAGAVRASKPEGLFTANVNQEKTIRNQYAVSPDGQRFLILSLTDREASPIVAILNWQRLIKR